MHRDREQHERAAPRRGVRDDRERSGFEPELHVAVDAARGEIADERADRLGREPAGVQAVDPVEERRSKPLLRIAFGVRQLVKLIPVYGQTAGAAAAAAASFATTYAMGKAASYFLIRRRQGRRRYGS